MDETLTHFKHLVEIVAKLRGPHGCPWDKAQTQKALTQHIIEESYELVEAIENGYQSEIREELGYVLFLTVLQAQVAQDEGYFNLGEVLQHLTEKLIFRHPHVFPKIEIENSTGTVSTCTASEAPLSLREIWTKWQHLKEEERQRKGSKQELFPYPAHLPALQVSNKIGKKTKTYHFDWSCTEDVFKKVEEELEELRHTLLGGSKASCKIQEKTNYTLQSMTDKDVKKAQEHEIGDLLFSIAQLARHLQIEPESALRTANQRFQKRFAEALRLSRKNIQDFGTLSTIEKEKFWSLAKELESKPHQT